MRRIIYSKGGIDIKCKRVRVNEIFMIKVKNRTRL